MKGIYEKDSNFFAIRKEYEGTLAGTTWYGAGDVVYYGDGKKRMLESIILKVESDGSVIVKNEMGIFSCSVKEMKSGHIAFGKERYSANTGVLAVRFKEQFTINLTDWFTTGPRCIIKPENKFFVGVDIAGVKDNGNIYVSYDGGDDDIIHYSEIVSIEDFLGNTSYLLFTTKKLRKKSPVIVTKHIKAKTKRYS